MLGGLPQVLWPAHCVAGSSGAEFHPAFQSARCDAIFAKGTDERIDSYSGFFDNGHRKATGLGDWSAAQIVTALQTGRRPDGRMLAPVMPWRAFAKLTKADAYAIAAFLKTLPPVSNKVPGPFGPKEQPSSFALKVVPGDQVLAPK